MRKSQIILLASGALLLLFLWVFGKTVNPNKIAQTPVPEKTNETLDFKAVLSSSKQRLTPWQKNKLEKLEMAAADAPIKEKIEIYNQLSNFWKDSARTYEPYLFYIAEAAKLENSEKSLTFAAQQFTSSLLEVADPSIQNWLATNAKVLFNRALAINPNNDSSKIGLGACYILGNISDNPMEGILPVKDLATKHPDNLFAQLVLGLGGKKSGQFDKAIERFLIIVEKQPSNIVIVLQLAECYEMKHDKINAAIWYKKAVDMINNADIKKEIEKRISDLK
ncbi:MAG: tetratricopeptide repeat protein [Chitinophagaceae bacterium]